MDLESQVVSGLGFGLHLNDIAPRDEVCVHVEPESSSLGFEVQRQGLPVPCPVCRVLCFGFQVSGSVRRFSGVVFRVPGSRFQVLGFGFQVAGFGITGMCRKGAAECHSSPRPRGTRHRTTRHCERACRVFLSNFVYRVCFVMYDSGLVTLRHLLVLCPSPVNLCPDLLDLSNLRAYSRIKMLAACRPVYGVLFLFQSQIACVDESQVATGPDQGLKESRMMRYASILGR